MKILNSKTHYMKNKSKIILLATIALIIVYICYLHYVNNSYERQISESNKLIESLILQDSIARSILPFHEDGTGTYYVVDRDAETKRALTHKDLDSLYLYYYRQCKLYEDILLYAKRKYDFNYSHLANGDSVKIAIWDK